MNIILKAYCIIISGLVLSLKGMERDNISKFNKTLTMLEQYSEPSSYKEVSIINDIKGSALVNEVKKEYFVLDSIGKEEAFSFQAINGKNYTTISFALDNDTEHDGMYVVKYHSPRPMRRQFPRELKISQIVAGLYNAHKIEGASPNGQREYAIEDVSITYKPFYNKKYPIMKTPKQFLKERSQSF